MPDGSAASEKFALLERITRWKLELLQVRQTTVSVSASKGVLRP